VKTIPERLCLNVPDGYNGATVDLDPTPLQMEANLVKLAVYGKPWLIRWVRREDYERHIAKGAS
jgi:hypothetical protein